MEKTNGNCQTGGIMPHCGTEVDSMKGLIVSASYQHVLVSYGNKLSYHHGAKYQILRNNHWYKTQTVCVITDQPELFSRYPVKILSLSDTKKEDWSLGGKDHFGIKLNSLKWAIDSADSSVSRSILLDTDMFWTKNPRDIARITSSDNTVLYKNEGLVIGSRNKSINKFEEGLENKKIDCGFIEYELSTKSRMWGSAIISLHHSNSKLLDEAFTLFSRLLPHVNAHTIEQFALSETLRRHKQTMISKQNYVDDWSSTGKKEYATEVLTDFFRKYGEFDFKNHLQRLNEVRIKRPIQVLVKQKIERWKSQ